MIVVARHGQTEWNVAGRKQGRLDSPLTSTGLQQAQLLGRFLATRSESITAVFSSPLGRALETASIAVETAGISPTLLHVEPLLAEAGLGSWQGLTDADIEASYPGQAAAREADKWRYRIAGGGESYSDCAARCRVFLEQRAITGVESGTIVIVTHEIVSRVLRGVLCGFSRQKTLALDHLQDRVYLIDRAMVQEHHLD